MAMTTYRLQSEEQTMALGYRLGEQLSPNAVLCFFGDLGSGKTTLIKGIVAAATGCAVEDVRSPTFTYLSTYQGARTVYHFDLYRLHGVDEFLSMGFDEMFASSGICCIEWSERIEGILPDGNVRIEMSHGSQDDGEAVRYIKIAVSDDQKYIL
jgi:tRNA threonylcarbamoyladenosine biosynthesis protein TsaE